MKKIFYSWQSDNSTDRNYIARRLEQAVGQLEDWEVDTAVRNTQGSVDIAATILSKIDDCDLFIADVSIINPGAGDRECPNPNVMYELGYAAAAKGEANIILIANGVTTNTANLPFDVRNRNMILRDLNTANKTTITSELARIMQDHQSPQQSPDIPTIELLTGSEGWANWSGQGNAQSGFRYHLSVDNFGGTVDYISNVRAEAINDQGDPWSTTYYKFDELEPNIPLEIEANRITDRWVFLTDQPGQTQRLLPDLDRDRVNLVVTLRRNGRQVVIQVPPGRLQNH